MREYESEARALQQKWIELLYLGLMTWWWNRRRRRVQADNRLGKAVGVIAKCYLLYRTGHKLRTSTNCLLWFLRVHIKFKGFLGAWQNMYQTLKTRVVSVQ